MRRTTRTAAVTTATLIALLGLAGCGSSGGSSAGGSSSPSSVASATGSPSPSSVSPSASASSGGSSSSASATITIKNFAYKTSGTVKAGATVMIKNDDTEAHTVTADSSGGFDVKILPGKTAKLTAPAAGTYKYHCTYHSDMHGTLVVS
ncbi:hypothetical protein GCM10027596_41340 [Nocardioides korecus]